MLQAKLHGFFVRTRAPSYCEITVLFTILSGILQAVWLSQYQKAAEKQKGVQERKQKCWQVAVPGEILG